MALTDHESILTVIASYAQAVDRRDRDLFTSAFTADAVLEIGRSGRVRYEGRDAILDAVGSNWETSEPGKHLCTNALLQIEGATATGTVDFAMFGPDKLLAQAGYYEDRFVKSEAGWQIASRRIVAQLR